MKSKRKKTRKQLLIKRIDYLNHLPQDFLFFSLYFPLFILTLLSVKLAFKFLHFSSTVQRDLIFRDKKP